jgi:hypothetical protein
LTPAGPLPTITALDGSDAFTGHDTGQDTESDETDWGRLVARRWTWRPDLRTGAVLIGALFAFLTAVWLRNLPGPGQRCDRQLRRPQRPRPLGLGFGAVWTQLATALAHLLLAAFISLLQEPVPR